MAGFYETLNLQKYKKAMSGAYQNYGLVPSSLSDVGDVTFELAENDLDTYRTNALIQKTRQKSERDMSELEENHDDDLTFFEKAGNFITNIGYSIFEGLLNFVDFVGDLGMGAVGTVAGWTGNTELRDAMEQGITTDWQGATLNATNKVTQLLNPLQWAGAWAGSGFFDKVGTSEYWTSGTGSPDEARENFNKTRYGTDLSTGVTDVISGVGQGIGQMIVPIGIGKAVGGAITNAGSALSKLSPAIANYVPQVAKTANIVTQASLGFAQGSARGTQQAVRDGQHLGDWKTIAYSTVQGAIQGLEQGLSAGIGGTFSNNVTNGVGQGVANFALKHGSSTGFANFIGKVFTIASDALMDSAIDFGEELLEPFVKSIYDSGAFNEAYGSPEAVRNTFENAGKVAMISALTSSLINTGKAVSGSDFNQDFVAQRRKQVIEQEMNKTSFVENQKFVEATKVEVERLNSAIDTMKKDVDATTDTKVRKEKQKLLNDAVKERDAVLRRGAEASDEMINELNKSMYSSGVAKKRNKKENTHNINLNLLNDIKNENISNKVKAGDVNPKYTDRRYQSVNGFSVRLAKDGTTLEYRPNSASETYDALSAIKHTKQDTVSLQRGDLGIMGKSRISVSPKYVSDTDIVGLQNIIMDTTINVAGQWKHDNGDIYIEYSNGTNITLAKDTETSQFIKYVNMRTKPNWATDETKLTLAQQARGDVPSAYQSRVAIDEYVPSNDMKQIVKGVSSEFSSLFDDLNLKVSRNKSTDGNVKLDTFDEWSKRFGTAIATNDKSQYRAIINQGSEELLDTEFIFERNVTDTDGKQRTVTETGKVRDYMSNDEVANFKADFENYVDNCLRVGDFEKMRTDMQNKIDTQQQRYEDVIARKDAKYIRAVGKLKNDIIGIKRRLHSSSNIHKTILNAVKYKNRTDPKSPTHTSKSTIMYPIVDQWVSSFNNFAGNGNVNSKMLANALFGKVKYNEASFDEAGVDLYDPRVKEIMDELESHFSDVKEKVVGDDGKEVEITKKVYYGEDEHTSKNAKKNLTVEDQERVADVLKTLMKTNSREFRQQKIKLRAEMLPVVEEVSALVTNDTNFNTIASSVQGFEYRFRKLFGEGSMAYKVIFGDPVRAHYNSSLQKYRFVQEMNAMIEANKLKINDFTKVIKGGKLDGITKGQAIELYIQALSPENHEQMSRYGFSTVIKKNLFEAKYDDDIEAFLEENLTKQEKTFANDLFAYGYNRSVKQVLSRYSLEKYGYDMFDGSDTYVHRSMTSSEYKVGSNDYFNSLSGALGSKIATKRVKNANKIRIINAIDAFSNYAGQAADFVSLDSVRTLNQVINMKDRNSASIKDMFDGSKNGSGKAFFDNWVKTVNGIQTVREGNSKAFVNRLFANAMITPIEMNIGTYIKMFLDVIRLPSATYTGTRVITEADGTRREIKVSNKRVGFGSLLKGIIYGMFSKVIPSSINCLSVNGDTATNYFKENSGFYIRQNAEGAIQNKYFVSNVFTDNFSRVRNLLSKGLQFTQNAMLTHLAFPIMQQFAKNMGYGDPMSNDVQARRINAMKATEMFDTIAVKALSNGDSLDMSDLRSGRLGSFLKAFFGVFGADAQKKVEAFSEMVTANADARRIANASEAVKKNVTEQRKKLELENDDLDNQIRDIRKQIVEKTEEGGRTGNLERKLTSLENKRDENVRYIEGYKKAYDDAEASRVAQIERTSVKNTFGRAGNIVAVFVISALAEQVANVVNDLAKGKDVESLDKQLEDIGFDISVGWIPYISTIANAVKYNDKLSALPVEGINQLVQTLTSITNLQANGSEENQRKMYFNAFNSLGYLTGIPFKSMFDYVTGAMKNVDKNVGNGSHGEYVYSLLKGYNATYLSIQTKEALEKNDTRRAIELTQASMSLFKSGVTDWNTCQEIVLRGASVSIVPEDYTPYQKDTFLDTYSKVNSVVKSFINSKYYKSLGNETKGKELTKLYRAYFLVAKSNVEGSEVTGDLAKALDKYLFGTGGLTSDERKLLKQYRILSY